MQPTPRRPNETEEAYNARVAALADWMFNGGAAAYIAQEKRAGRIRTVKMRKCQDPFDALLEQHPDLTICKLARGE